MGLFSSPSPFLIPITTPVHMHSFSLVFLLLRDSTHSGLGVDSLEVILGFSSLLLTWASSHKAHWPHYEEESLSISLRAPCHIPIHLSLAWLPRSPQLVSTLTLSLLQSASYTAYGLIFLPHISFHDHFMTVLSWPLSVLITLQSCPPLWLPACNLLYQGQSYKSLTYSPLWGTKANYWTLHLSLNTIFFIKSFISWILTYT